jgi:hypothetical protein
MDANRLTAARLWAGAAVFGTFAVLAWPAAIQLVPWNFLIRTADFGGGGGGMAGGFFSVGLFEMSVVVGLPLIGNVLIVGEAGREQAARRLRRLHLLAWVGSIAAAISIFLVPPAAAPWMILVGILLIPTQLTLLAATFVALAIARARRIA